MIRSLTIMCLMTLAVALPWGASGQDVLRIAAVVNEEVVTIHDLERRIDLVIATTRFQDSPEGRRRLRSQVLRQLIDERLQLAEAKRIGIGVLPTEVDQRLNGIARQNNMTREQFDAAIKGGGIDLSTLEQQVNAEIAWGRVLQARLRPLIRVSDDEIDEATAKFEAARGQPEALVAEILLPVDQRDQEEEALRGAQRLVDQIRSGASFAAVARQFSAGATAGVGGDIGWLLPGQLPPELDAAVQALAAGEVSEPIRTFGGYAIVSVRERRQALAADPLATRVTLSQFVAPATRNAPPAEIEAARSRIHAVAATATGCEDLDRRAKEANAPASGRLGTFTLRDLPQDLQKLVATIPVGRMSQPIESDIGFRVVAVCERVEPPKAAPPSRSDVQANLEMRRLSLLGQRYLRNLRRDAFLEIR